MDPVVTGRPNLGQSRIIKWRPEVTKLISNPKMLTYPHKLSPSE
jgi:hypothetical protein